MTFDSNNQYQKELRRLENELKAKDKELALEASLETVRNVAFGLQKSEDMLDIAQVLYEQLLHLGFLDIRNSIIDLHNDDDETFWDFDYSHEMSGTVTLMRHDDDPIIERQYQKIISSTDAFFELFLEGQELQDLIDMRLKNGEPEDPRLLQIEQLTYNLYSFGNGAIGISNFGVLSDEQKTILKRFRNVFTFAYQRYHELTQAEATARLAKIDVAVERIRSKTIGMKKSNELGMVVELLYDELSRLIDDLWICGFVLCEENSLEDNWWISSQNGFTPTFMVPNVGDSALEKFRKVWEDGKEFQSQILEGEALKNHFAWLREVANSNGLFGENKNDLHNWQKLHCAPFKKGYLIIITKTSCDEKDLFKRFAHAFDHTYTRFLDLQLKEKQSIELLQEKQRLEAAISELQDAQQLLIQKEKMASLGELTAGIAHEIQNPLNFVNNYAEVSMELLDEMDEEIGNGDLEEAKSLSESIHQNLEKIHTHGQRADGIVRAMLQHSRKNTSEKVPTDINELTDEYLRLAYHGLRAKDKTFNAKIITSFDDSIGNINIVPQDIGRVVLNIISNAFYACDQKAKSSSDKDYEPTVSVKTEKVKATIKDSKTEHNEAVYISVKDNANGMSKELQDKIFEPFFTTKPTGEGTGLGLSMSYDIVRKHGGILKVSSSIDIGTEFCIQIPLEKKLN